MGIRDLWSILEPYHERKPLYELSGKVIAIDLGGWVCENQNVVDYPVQPRLYLRNLFHRTCYLLLADVTPVFVLEGEAPTMKYDEIARRNDIQFRGGAPKKKPSADSTKDTRKGRTRFNGVLKICENLLTIMGVECVKGPGEAEAFCAHLNRDGLVDGVVSQDSDCFAYGARKVFRNFSVAKQGSVAASGGAVDVYDMEKISPILDLGQNKLIVLALLAGCDYCPGVSGVGKDSVLKLFGHYTEAEILKHIRNWRNQEEKFRKLEVKIEDKNICVNCGHAGKLVSHTRKGCVSCHLSAGCDSTLWKEQRLVIKTEVQMRRKALVSMDFPREDIIEEFLRRSATPNTLNLSWKRPAITRFIRLTMKYLQWEEIYAFQKIFPLLTRWQLKHPMEEGLVSPKEIKKKRTLKGVSSFEIIWQNCSPDLDDLIPDEQLTTFLLDNPTGIDSLWTTIEPADIVESVHPRLVEQFYADHPKKRKKKRKQDESLSNFDELKDELVRIGKKKASTRKGPIPKGVQKIDEFFRKIEKPDKEDSILKAVENIQDFNDDDENLSEIIAEIVSRSPKVTDLNGRKLSYDVIQAPPTANEATAPGSPVKNEKLPEDDFDELDFLVAGTIPAQFSTPKTKSSLQVEEPKIAYLLENLNTTVDLFESSLELSRKQFFEEESD
ncbi:Flap endonuclease GEN [Sergentomyia squamirostris]